MATGIAIHIGVNKVDPEHYQNEQGQPWETELAAAEQDAQSLALLSETQGFTSRMLLGEDATSANVIESLQFASEVLEGGDALLVSFSGFGGQVPDRFTEQETRHDESWCLYDRQLIDDELYALWARFNSGVRILLLSDCCHNDKVARRPMFATVSKPGGPAARLLPDSEQKGTYARHQRLYDDIQREHPEGDRAAAKASVIVIQGCQDNQIAFDGSPNGLFTGAVLRVWDEGGFKGSLIHFWRSIIDQMPMYQCPNLFRVGVQNPAYEQQRPFSVDAPEGQESEPAVLQPVFSILPESPLQPAEAAQEAALPAAPSFEPVSQPSPFVQPVHPLPMAPSAPIIPAGQAAGFEPEEPRRSEPAAAALAVPPLPEPSPAYSDAQPLAAAHLARQSEAAHVETEEPVKAHLQDEWHDFVKTGFGSVQTLLNQTMASYMRSYHITLAVYATVFGIGLIFMIVALLFGLTSDRLAITLAFGALSIAVLFFFFMLSPIQALEENLECISMLGVAITNYWARLMHIKEGEQAQSEFKAAAEDYNATIETFRSQRASRRAEQESRPVSSPLTALRSRRPRGIFAPAPVLKSVTDQDPG